MAQAINVNGVSINYPETGDTNWSDDATNFAVQTSSALGKIGLSSGTNVDVAGILDVTGATTLDSTLTVAGTTTLNGNTNLGNATSDTIAVTGVLNVDSGVLYVDPTNNRVGVNKTNPAQALDVTGNALISGTLGVTGNSTFTGDVIASIVKASGSGGLTIDSNGGTDVALFGAGGGSGTTLYGGLNGTTGNFADTTDATTSTDGALKTAGGVGIAKKLFVGTDANIGGNSNITGRNLVGNGTASLPAYSYLNENNSGLFRESAGVIGMSVLGTKRFSIDSNGHFLKSNNVAGHFERTTSYLVSTVVNFDTAILNNTNYNTTNGRFTAPVTGTYFFYVQGINVNSSRVGTYFRKNGVQYTNNLSSVDTTAGGIQAGCHTAIIQLNQSEYVDVFNGYAGTYVYAKACFFGFYLIG